MFATLKIDFSEKIEIEDGLYHYAPSIDIMTAIKNFKAWAINNQFPFKVELIPQHFDEKIGSSLHPKEEMLTYKVMIEWLSKGYKVVIK